MPAKKAKTEFDLGNLPGFADDEARKAFEAALDSFSRWRDDIVATTERNSDKVFDAIAQAAKALGWPEDVVESLRLQMEGTTELQVQYMNSVMDAWMTQVKNPSTQMANPREWFAQMPALNKAFPGLNIPNFGAKGFDPTSLAQNPFQFWMQGAAFWQKAWMQAFNAWSEMQKSAVSKK